MFAAWPRRRTSTAAGCIDLYRERFGEHIPLIRRQDVGALSAASRVDGRGRSGLDAVRKQAEAMEVEAGDFYARAAARSHRCRRAQAAGRPGRGEADHVSSATGSRQRHLDAGAEERGARPRRRMFVLQVVQPGLAGLMDGSVSTLAPLFAAAFATHETWQTFLVGMAASVGAGISMGFAEALSDDGELTGRGHPLLRGIVTGLMTTIGGVGHTLPYLIPDFRVATTLAIARRAGRAVGHRLDPRALHGHAVPARGLPGGGRRPDRVRGRHPDRQRLTGTRARCCARRPRRWRTSSPSRYAAARSPVSAAHRQALDDLDPGALHRLQMRVADEHLRD